MEPRFIWNPIFRKSVTEIYVNSGVYRREGLVSTHPDSTHPLTSPGA